MPIYNSKNFPESNLAHELLDGLRGIEIGGSYHNAFGLMTINIDKFSHTDLSFEPYANEQVKLCGEVMPVDIVSPGDYIPLPSQSYDFVINSHVIEHFHNPIKTIKEWMRIATQYIFMIVPQRDALESDKDKPLTELQEHIDRYLNHVEGTSDEHHSRWTPNSFTQMCEWICLQTWAKNWEIVRVQSPDDKVGNGFTVVLKQKNL